MINTCRRCLSKGQTEMEDQVCYLSLAHLWLGGMRQTTRCTLCKRRNLVDLNLMAFVGLVQLHLALDTKACEHSWRAIDRMYSASMDLDTKLVSKKDLVEVDIILDVLMQVQTELPKHASNGG